MKTQEIRTIHPEENPKVFITLFLNVGGKWHLRFSPDNESSCKNHTSSHFDKWPHLSQRKSSVWNAFCSQFVASEPNLGDLTWVALSAFRKLPSEPQKWERKKVFTGRTVLPVTAKLTLTCELIEVTLKLIKEVIVSACVLVREPAYSLVQNIKDMSSLTTPFPWNWFPCWFGACSTCKPVAFPPLKSHVIMSLYNVSPQRTQSGT